MSKDTPIKRITASDAKNNFGGLLEDVVSLGCVGIVKHGRPVAFVLSARAFEALQSIDEKAAGTSKWGENHMIPAHLARGAKIVRPSRGFDEE